MKLNLFETTEREETKEEMEKRKKDMLEKQASNKKKGGKKEEFIEEMPIKIKEIKISNLELRSDMPTYSKWVTSQLQIIIDRNILDVNVTILPSIFL